MQIYMIKALICICISLTDVLSLEKISTSTKHFDHRAQLDFKPNDSIHIKNSLATKKEPSSDKKITLDVKEISKNVINFIFREKDTPRFELPEAEPFPFHKKSSYHNANTDYSFEIDKQPFSLTIKRKTTNEVIFTSKSFDVVFSENYAEITTLLPTNNIFGLGERTTSFKVKPGLYTMYNRDAYGEYDDGSGGKNRYGSHPMYLMREQSGNYHITYLRNAFPMDVLITAHEQKEDKTYYTLTYKLTGGVLDFSIFLGDKNPETATKNYHDFLGGHSLPPFWAMGFHQSRWGYNNLTMILDVLENYKTHNLPLDTIWMDVDYMQEYVPFTVDETRYNITLFRDCLQTYKKKFVMIAEPAMATKWPEYEYLVQGKEMDLFIKNKEGDYLINRVWPGDCHFIDFFHPNATTYWHGALEDLTQKLDYSGIWLDMNEIATFEPGQVDEEDCRISCNDDTVYPYLPGGQQLERNTICPNAVHYDGRTHVKLHNYLPVQQQMLTYKFLEKQYPDQFPFILSRANSAGTGRWSAHWSGDNVGNFVFYKGSVSEVLNNNLYGIPMIGTDICGFGENTPEILCAKFYQMGSLFPFSRSHAAEGTIRKEPWQMGHTLLTTVQKSLQFRYEILKYYYSLFILNGGVGTVFRPLFYNFHHDEEVLKDNILDNQFMIGGDLLVVPNFNDDETTVKVNAYFPRGSWFDLRSDVQIPTKGGYLEILAQLNEMPPVFLKGGSTIFKNRVDGVMNTYDLNDEFDMLIAFDNSQGAILTSTGKIPALNNYNSKRKVNNCIKHKAFISINSIYNTKNKNLRINIIASQFYDKDYSPLIIRSFKIYGIPLNKDAKLKISNLNELPIHNESELIYQGFLRESHSHSEFAALTESNYTIKLADENYLIVDIVESLQLDKNKNVQIFLNFD